MTIAAMSDMAMNQVVPPRNSPKAAPVLAVLVSRTNEPKTSIDSPIAMPLTTTLFTTWSRMMMTRAVANIRNCASVSAPGLSFEGTILLSLLALYAEARVRHDLKARLLDLLPAGAAGTV